MKHVLPLLMFTVFGAGCDSAGDEPDWWGVQRAVADG